MLKIEGTSSCGKDWRGSGAVPERSAGMKAEAATLESLFFAQIRCGGDGQKAALNEKMAENQIRRIPVVDNNKVVGILTLGDLAKYSQKTGKENFSNTFEEICDCGHKNNR